MEFDTSSGAKVLSTSDKLERELASVLETVIVCRERMQTPASRSLDFDPKDPVLFKLIGYLEACRDRLVDLIEAGSHGLLSESLLSLSLRVNDAVTKTLEAERTGIPLSVHDACTSLHQESSPVHSATSQLESTSSSSPPALLDLNIDHNQPLKSKSQPMESQITVASTIAVNNSSNSNSTLDDLDAFLNSHSVAHRDLSAQPVGIKQNEIKSSESDDVDVFLRSLDASAGVKKDFTS